MTPLWGMRGTVFYAVRGNDIDYKKALAQTGPIG